MLISFLSTSARALVIQRLGVAIPGHDGTARSWDRYSGKALVRSRSEGVSDRF